VSRAPTSIPYVSVGLRGLELLPRLHLYQLIAQTAQGPAQRKNRVQMQHMTEHTRDHKPADTTISFSSSKPTTTTSASVQGSGLSTNLLHWPPCKRRITHSPQPKESKKETTHASNRQLPTCHVITSAVDGQLQEEPLLFSSLKNTACDKGVDKNSRQDGCQDRHNSIRHSVKQLQFLPASLTISVSIYAAIHLMQEFIH